MINNRRTNIHKVAEVANVSAMTVTRVFNNSGPVADKTRSKVLAVASKLGYRPNIMAKSLRSGKTNSIGLLWSLTGPHSSISVVRNISIRLMNNGYACNVADSLSDPKIIKQCLADFSSRNIDGVIVQLIPKMLDDKEILALLHEIRNVVLVVFDDVETEFDKLVRDRTQAARDVVDYFAASGRKKIVFFSSKNISKEQAFLEQLKRHDLPVIENSIVHFVRQWDDDEADIGRVYVETLEHYFGDKIPFDAVMTSCDEGAFAIMDCLSQKGFKIPEDIAVVGFNNSALAPYSRPRLASVDRRNIELADMVSKMILNRLKQKGIKQQVERLEMKFEKRESAG